ncbi:MAG: ubiquinol-cytochrome c reductase [Phycisphaeraceae bacterium]|nr:MAG: ubiquinol-cytochrome c reductase [Phycisphaeraceae bacterium]
MATFLIKTEPDDYCFDDLVRDKRTDWTGVRNPAAQMHMRAIKKGDECLFYHTGKEKRIVGLAKVVKGPYPDPAVPGTTKAGDPKGVLFDIAPVRAAGEGCTLAAVKADGRFEGFALVREARLSVMPVPAKFDTILRTMAGL